MNRGIEHFFWVHPCSSVIITGGGSYGSLVGLYLESCIFSVLSLRVNVAFSVNGYGWTYSMSSRSWKMLPLICTNIFVCISIPRPALCETGKNIFAFITDIVYVRIWDKNGVSGVNIVQKLKKTLRFARNSVFQGPLLLKSFKQPFSNHRKICDCLHKSISSSSSVINYVWWVGMLMFAVNLFIMVR